MPVVRYTLKKELLILISVMVWMIFCCIKNVKNRKNTNKISIKESFFQISLVIYLSLVIGVTLLPINIPRNDYRIETFINLNVLDIFKYGFNKYSIINLIGNLLLLAPLPILLWLNKFDNWMNLKNIIIVSFLISLSIETIQYLEGYFRITAIPRASDILDLIMNTLGGVLGYYVLKIYNKINIKSDLEKAEG